MNPTYVFNQAIKGLLPDLDNQTRNEIENKVVVHMFETLKQEIFTDNSQEIEDLQRSLEETTESQKKIELYSKFLEKKYKELSPEKQTEIEDKQNEELTRVMHQIYQTYKKS